MAAHSYTYTFELAQGQNHLARAIVLNVPAELRSQIQLQGGYRRGPLSTKSSDAARALEDLLEDSGTEYSRSVLSSSDSKSLRIDSLVAWLSLLVPRQHRAAWAGDLLEDLAGYRREGRSKAFIGGQVWREFRNLMWERIAHFVKKVGGWIFSRFTAG